MLCSASSCAHLPYFFDLLVCCCIVLFASLCAGLTACTLHMGLHLLGKKNLALYDGSWTEYVTAAAAEPDALPIAKGPGAEAKKQH